MAPPKPPKITTSDFLLVFGPQNTYLARAPQISRSTLITSPDLSAILNDAKWVNFLIFPPVDSTDDPDDTAADPDVTTKYTTADPYLAYSKKSLLGDSKLFFPPEAYYPELKEWLAHRWGTGSLQVVGDGLGGWWALSSSATTKWLNLPGDVRQFLKPVNPHGKVSHLALGVSGSYIVLFEDGHVDWDLKGCYDRLDDHLEGRSQGELVYVSLSVYAGHVFFAVFKDATVIYEFPKGSGDLDEDFLANEGLRVNVYSETAKHTGVPVSKAERPSALRKFSETVLTDVAEKEIEDVLTS